MGGGNRSEQASTAPTAVATSDFMGPPVVESLRLIGE